MNNNHIDLVSEIRLVKAAADGDKGAFCELYGEYREKLYRYALYRLGNPEDAEDAVSECVMAAWQGIPRLRNAEAFSAWIFRILHNCCVRRIRTSIEQRENTLRMYSEASQDAFRQSSDSSSPTVSIELQEALSQLSEEEREIVLLSVLGDLTSKEISEITALTPGAVRSKLSRSLAKMRKYLS